MNWRIATFNVNGIRARLPIVLDWLEERRPNVLCLQEIKCREKDFPFQAFTDIGYRAEVYGQKSFNGVAFISTSVSSDLTRGFLDGFSEGEARIISGRFDGVWIVNTYVPQGRNPSDPAFQFKLDFLGRLRSWFDSTFAHDSPLIWTGDINVAPEAMDVYDPERLDGEVGFHPEERAALQRVQSWAFTDLFRKHHPDRKQFTFWDYRIPKSLQRNLGWRLDHIYATGVIADASVACTVDEEPRRREKASDHTPVIAEIDLARIPRLPGV